MAGIKISRKAATPKGFLRRVLDADFEQVDDPRQQAWVVHPLIGLLKLAVLSLVSNARSTRAVENRSEQLRPPVRDELELDGRVSDNAFGLALSKLDWLQLREALHRQTKAEWRRKRLRPRCLPMSTVAIDGKHLATIPEKRLRSVLDENTPVDGFELNTNQMRYLLETQFPYIQLKEGDDGQLWGLLRVHRATLISSKAAVVLDQWPIRGETNEVGTIEATLSALFSAYGRTNIVEMVTLDAGNTSPEVANQLMEQEVDYFMALRQSQGQIHRLAQKKLAGLKSGEAAYCESLRERGKRICYTVWTHSIDSEGGYRGSRQLVRVRRVVLGEDETTVGNRYFVTSASAEKLDGSHLVEMARAHWRCENEGHWTADAIWDEDARRTPWTQHPEGLLVVGFLRMIAINILAVLRALSRLKRGDQWVTPTWKTVIEQALMVLCNPVLEMEEFNALDE